MTLHHDSTVLRIMARRCNECLYSRNKIVSDRERDHVLKVCELTETHFICHKASNAGHDVMCRGHWERTKYSTLRNRLAIGLGVVVEVTESALKEGHGSDASD